MWLHCPLLPRTRNGSLCVIYFTLLKINGNSPIGPIAGNLPFPPSLSPINWSEFCCHQTAGDHSEQQGDNCNVLSSHELVTGSTIH